MHGGSVRERSREAFTGETTGQVTVRGALSNGRPVTALIIDHLNETSASPRFDTAFLRATCCARLRRYLVKSSIRSACAPICAAQRFSIRWALMMASGVRQRFNLIFRFDLSISVEAGEHQCVGFGWEAGPGWTGCYIGGHLRISGEDTKTNTFNTVTGALDRSDGYNKSNAYDGLQLGCDFAMSSRVVVGGVADVPVSHRHPCSRIRAWPHRLHV
jgi:hypothetical protein